MAPNTTTVSADWLEARLSEPGLSIVDGSWYLPAQNRVARAEYEAGHIPGAVFFDQDLVVEPDTGLPHALPNPKLFAQFAGAMGLSVDDQIVVYDGPGFFSSARVWWLLRVMGARRVFVLDGGFDRWTREGRPVTADATKIAPCLFQAEFDASQVAGFDEMRAIVDERRAQVVDVRPADRFSGAVPEPRAGMRSGHMPGALNVPFAALSRDGRLLSPAELRGVLQNAGVDLTKPVVTSCGSGVTAAVLTLALETLGHDENKLYDGSWSEWGGRADTSVETGSPARP